MNYDDGPQTRDDAFDSKRFTRDKSRSPYRRDKSGNQSPFRLDQNASSKRRHDDDHYGPNSGTDSRRFKVHYEDKRHAARGSQQNLGRSARRGYNDRDRPNRPSRSPSFDDDKLKGRDLSQTNGLDRFERERSRSPYRHDKHKNTKSNHTNWGRTPTSNDAARLSSGDRPQDLQARKREFSYKDTGPSLSGVQRSTLTSAIGGSDVMISSDISKPKLSEEEKQGDMDEPEVTLSEAELIEQRRKRREAIKAKHKTTQPLLVQAIEQSIASTPGTNGGDMSTDSPEQHSPVSHSSPQTTQSPYPDSQPASPASFTIENDEDLIDRRSNHTEGTEEGPSAADYDPDMDMQKGKQEIRDQALLQNAEIGDSGMLAAVAQDQNTTQGDDFDMFAEDDDDMFAPADVSMKPVAGRTQARTLDQSLLDNWDYPDGHYRIILGELLDDRYAVKQQIGKGTFATVVRAEDTRDGTSVAIKIACNNDTMYKAGQKEMDILSILNKSDEDDKRHIIRLIRQFEHKGHLCLVFENLSADLREVLKKFGRNVGLNLKAIRSYAQQMFLALGHLKKCQILHADLKPDNMLVSEKRNLLKICDLGTASFAADAEITPYLVSRFYRAPEVILGIPFDYAIDMWSVGCTLFELYTGRILFAGSDNNQMLRVIQECRGKFPMRMLKRASLVDKHFDANGNFYSQERDKITGKPTLRVMNLNRVSQGKDLRARLSGNVKDMGIDEIKEHSSFVDLMEKCLQLDPARRVSPNEALRHPFLITGVTATQQGGEKKVKEPTKSKQTFLRRP